MPNQSIRLYLYSSAAILALTLFWGFRVIPKQGAMAERALHTSLEQELVLLSSAVKSSTQALKFRLLDVLKAEGNEHSTRSFQQSPFVSATLLEWDQTQWKMLWHSSKFKKDFRQDDVRQWMKNWPLAKIGAEETFFVKVGELQGQTYFAVVVPVRKPNNIPMFGIGIFPAAQFGLAFSGERVRETRVFDDKGFALALAHPAYLGASLKREALVQEALSGDEVNTRLDFKDEAGRSLLGVATRMADSNLFASIETPASLAGGWKLQSWLFLLIGAAGAVLLNWVLFSNLHQPLLKQLAQTEDTVEQLKKQLHERPAQPVSSTALAVHEPALPTIDFIERSKSDEGPLPIITASTPAPTYVSLGKILQMAIRGLDHKIKQAEAKLQWAGLDSIQLEMDVLQLQTAIEEVLKNAIEAVQDSEFKWVMIDAEVANGMVRMKVTDKGRGISKENLQKVFDPFFSTKDSEGVARGLGLNVVRRVIEELKGKVAIESSNEEAESGTTVTLEWPAGNQAAAEVKTPIEAAAVPTPAPAAAEPVVAAKAPAPDDLEIEIDDIQFEVAETFKAAPLIRKPKVRTLEN